MPDKGTVDIGAHDACLAIRIAVKPGQKSTSTDRNRSPAIGFS